MYRPEYVLCTQYALTKRKCNFYNNMYLVQVNVHCTRKCTLYNVQKYVLCKTICFLSTQYWKNWVFFFLFLASEVIYFIFSFTNFFLSNKVKKIYYIQQLYCLKKLWFFREITSPVGSEYFSVVGLDRHLRVYKIKGK